MAPTRAKLEAIAERWISLWSAPVDWKLFDELHADDFEDCSAAGRETSKAAFAGGIADLIAAFPDLHTRVDDLIVDVPASRVAVRWSAVGTNKQRYLDIGPTGRETLVTGIEIIEVRGDRVVRRWGEWDITAHTATAGR
jgi:predicted ester cyclase